MCASARASARRGGADDQSARHQLTVRLLGPLEVSVDGRWVELTAGRVRSLLAVLALSAGEPVSLERLAEALWNGMLPSNDRKAVQTYVTRLRGVHPVRAPSDPPVPWRGSVGTPNLTGPTTSCLGRVAAAVGGRISVGPRALRTSCIQASRREPAGRFVFGFGRRCASPHSRRTPTPECRRRSRRDDHDVSTTPVSGAATA